MFLNLYKQSRETRYLEIAKQLGNHTIGVPLNKTIVSDGGLCHGAAGCAHMYNRLYQETGEAAFKDAALKWYTILFDTYYRPGKGASSFLAYSHNSETNQKEYKKNSGFLNGTAGIGLSILAGLSDTEPKWDYCMLLS
jgi:lantibiotic modifying enzyme